VREIFLGVYFVFHGPSCFLLLLWLRINLNIIDLPCSCWEAVLINCKKKLPG
jgi:hypothetical protein